jgi:hypothetical protein
MGNEIVTWRHLDMQMAKWAPRLTSEVKLPSAVTLSLATAIAADIRFLPIEKKNELRRISLVTPEDRLDELKAFQGFMDQTENTRGIPELTRARVIVQNYVCFVYLPESCFREIAKIAPKDSAARKCAYFLSKNPIRALRNAIAHANWTYRADFSGIVYWARKGDNRNEPVERFEVDQENLEFWQQLARCVAYATYSNL